jgi:hypothetical protein
MFCRASPQLGTPNRDSLASLAMNVSMTIGVMKARVVQASALRHVVYMSSAIIAMINVHLD